MASENWMWIIFLGIVALFLIGFPIMIFIAALAEKRQVPVSPSAAPPLAPSGALGVLSYDTTRVVDPPNLDKPHPALSAAISQGWELVGHFWDGDAGIKRGIESFAISGDQLILMVIRHGRLMGRIQLNTRLENGIWMVTTTSSTIRDLTGTEDEAELTDARFEQLLEYHMERVAGGRSAVLPFSSNSANEQMLEHKAEQVQRMVNTGLARYCNAHKTLWSFTPLGALRVALGAFSRRSMFCERPSQGSRQKAENIVRLVRKMSSRHGVRIFLSCSRLSLAGHERISDALTGDQLGPGPALDHSRHYSADPRPCFCRLPYPYIRCVADRHCPRVILPSTEGFGSPSKTSHAGCRTEQRL